MIVFLVFWLIALTALVVIGGLAIIGKFARVGRNIDEALDKVYDDIEEIHGVVDGFLGDLKNLQTEVENLKIQAGATQETLIDQMGNVTSQVSGLIETTAGLHSMIEKGYEDRPVTAALPVVASPVHNNKGGRPRKGQ